jgi:hypothetical protein
VPVFEPSACFTTLHRLRALEWPKNLSASVRQHRLQLLPYPLLRPGQVECYDILFTPKRLLPSARERVLVGGPTVLENLALACVSCSLRKEACRSGRDPKTGRTVGLFHPRRQVWARHFRWEGVSVVGLTPTGRATVERLLMNQPLILNIRLEEALRGRHPTRESMVGLPHTGTTKLRWCAQWIQWKATHSSRVSGPR